MNPKIVTTCAAAALGLTTGSAREIPLNPTWTFFNPEGISTISNQSATGYDVTIADVRGNIPDPENPGEFLLTNAVRPRVFQIFDDLDMSVVGQSIEIRFDLELLTEIFDSNRGDLHLSLFDTSTNAEFINIIHIGPNPGRTDFMKFRIDRALTPDSVEFDPNNIVHLGVGGQSRGTAANHPGSPLAATGIVHTFTIRVERTSDATLSFSTTWENDGNSSTYSFSSYNETTGVIDGEADPSTDGNQTDAWPNQKLTQFNGFALMLHEDDPFNQDGNPATPDEGTIRISNFNLDYTSPIHPPFKIIEVIRGDDNIIRWEAIPGESYAVLTSTDLSAGSFENGELTDGVIPTTEVGEYIDNQSPGDSRQRYYIVEWRPEGS